MAGDLPGHFSSVPIREPVMLRELNFVDATFTIFVGRLFTKLFEAIPPTATFPCVYRACNPD